MLHRGNKACKEISPCLFTVTLQIIIDSFTYWRCCLLVFLVVGLVSECVLCCWLLFFCIFFRGGEWTLRSGSARLVSDSIWRENMSAAVRQTPTQNRFVIFCFWASASGFNRIHTKPSGKFSDSPPTPKKKKKRERSKRKREKKLRKSHRCGVVC